MNKSIMIAALLAIAGSTMAATYHVAKTGKNSNVGSEAAPWETIQYAIDHSAAGDTIIVHAGSYIGQVTIKHAVNLQAKVGERPVIDGTGLTANDNGLVGIDGQSNVLVQGFTIQNYKTTKSTSVPIGIFVQGGGNNIQLRDNIVTKIYNTGANAGAINALGIAVYGSNKTTPVKNLVIDNNEIFDTKTGNSETLTVNGNVDGFEVTNNRVHDVNNIGIDFIGWENTARQSPNDYARNGHVAGNEVYNVTSSTNPSYHGERSAGGIYVDGGADIVIERNIVHNTDIGVELAAEKPGKRTRNVTLRNNLIYSSFTPGISIGGYGRTRGGTENCTIVNNTLYHNDTTNSGSGEFQVQFNTSGNVLENNLFWASNQGVFVFSYNGKNSAVGVASDNNLYYTTATPRWRWNGVNYTSLTAFANGTGGDSHSLFVLPGVANESSLDFHLNSTSPAVNAGAGLPTSQIGNFDLDGNPRVKGAKEDIGCYERQ